MSVVFDRIRDWRRKKKEKKKKKKKKKKEIPTACMRAYRGGHKVPPCHAARRSRTQTQRYVTST